MFTGHKERLSGVDLAEKLTGAKIAIFNPQVTCLHRLEHVSEQRALLGMAIFTRKNIGHQAQGRFIDHQRFPWQSPRLNASQHLEAMLRRFDAVAIDNFDPIARQPRRALAIQVLNQRAELTGAIAHQLRRRVGL